MTYSFPPPAKASRNWTELQSDANIPEALLSRQNCMVLSIATTLELHDSKTVKRGYFCRHVLSRLYHLPGKYAS